MKHIWENKTVLLRWIEGKLDADQRAGLEAHLQHCPACSRYANKVRQILLEPNTDSLPRLQASPYLLTCIREQAARKPLPAATSDGWRLALQRFSLAVLFCLAILTGIFLGRQLAQSPPAEALDPILSYEELFQPQDVSSSLALLLEANVEEAP